jgi:hypothetical protein
MSEIEPANLVVPLRSARGAVALGAALLLGLAVLAVFARVDRERVATLEQFSETTAVGDTVYYPLPDPPPNPPIPVARLNGEELVPVSYSKLEWRDSKMVRLAYDAGSHLTIYATREPLPESAGEPRGSKVYFVKTAANEYLRLRPAASAK